MGVITIVYRPLSMQHFSYSSGTVAFKKRIHFVNILFPGNVNSKVGDQPVIIHIHTHNSLQGNRKKKKILKDKNNQLLQHELYIADAVMGWCASSCMYVSNEISPSAGKLICWCAGSLRLGKYQKCRNAVRDLDLENEVKVRKEATKYQLAMSWTFLNT